MAPPTPTSLPASKTKIGFSIDSIIGEDVIRSPHRSDANQFFNLHAGPIRPIPQYIHPLPPYIQPIPQYIKPLPQYIQQPPQYIQLPPQYIQPQFQTAAAIAPRQAERSFPAIAKLGSHPPHPNMGRENYPLSWSLTRHGRIYPPRCPGNVRQRPFTKPKQVRKTFSPSQLLKLEHSFKSNQHMVGSDRKALAQALNLSERHVTIWFQNRRQNLKKNKQKDDSKGGSIEEDEMIDVEGLSEDEMIDVEGISEDDGVP